RSYGDWSSDVCSSDLVHRRTSQLADGLHSLGLKITHENFVDTIRVEVESSATLLEHAEKAGCNLRALGPRAVGVSLDETTTAQEIGRASCRERVERRV